MHLCRRFLARRTSTLFYVRQQWLPLYLLAGEESWLPILSHQIRSFARAEILGERSADISHPYGTITEGVKGVAVCL